MDNLSVEDLTKALVRQYLYQNKLFKTYQCFEQEDIKANKRLTKSAVIKNLCLEHLVFSNKKSSAPLNSLLSILVNYLKSKFLKKVQSLSQQDKSTGKRSSKTSQNFYLPNTISATKISNDLNEVKPKTYIRPSSCRKPLKPQPIKYYQISTPNQQNKILSRIVSNKMGNIQQQSEPTKQIPKQIPIVIQSKKEQKPIIQDLTIQQFKVQISNQKININKDKIQPETRPTSEISNINFKQKGEVVVQTEPKKPKMISMFGKRKLQKKQSQEQKTHQIFTTPLKEEEKPVKYQYKPMKFEKFIIKQQINTELVYKKVFNNQTNKKKAKPIQQSISLPARKLLFQGQAKVLPKSWKQGILLSPFDSTYYGLQQLQGGPCGIIASLQCYFLKHLFYLSNKEPTNQEVRQNCLIAAIADLLLTINPKKVILTIPSILNTYAKDPVSIEDIQLITINQPTSIQQVYDAVYTNKSSFLGENNSGYSLLLYSCILTKGIEQISKQMDSSESPLIGNHGHCNQELVNLFITGKATTNLFDGTKTMEQNKDKIQFKGINQKGQFGFLTIFQTLNYIQVGRNLKNPKFPIWVICKQFHYHVLFAGNYLISQNNKTQKFDLVYFDGLYNCSDKVVLTVGKNSSSTEKVSNLPLIEQVLLTKWGRRQIDWNGSVKIL